MKILLVTTSEFGYLVDYHRYYTFLKKKGHDVKYICYDTGREKIEPGNPDIYYVTREGNKVSRHLRFIKSVINLEKEIVFDRIMVHVFPMASALLLSIPRQKLYLDIRTVSIHRKEYKRDFFDFLIRVASNFYQHTSSITHTAAKKIGIKKYKHLPLGGAYFGDDPVDPAVEEQYKDIFSSGDFIFLYVGTLNKRRIIECVQGFHAHLKKQPDAKAKFVIIGSSTGNEYNEVVEYIAKHNLGSSVKTLGYIPQTRLAYFFNNCHCGISFMPLTMPFPLQPNTKTYEYLVNGMAVIGTATEDNILMIETSKVPCGVIIKDSPEGIEYAVGKILEQKHLYIKQDIKKEFNRFEWDNLFNIYLEDALSLKPTR